MDPISIENIKGVLGGYQVSDRVDQWLRMVQPEDLYRVNLKQVADQTGSNLREFLDFFLLSTHHGIFNLSWEYHCPHCNAVPDFKHNFGDMKAAGFCPICDVDFRNSLDQNVEVTFTIHPSIMEVPSGVEESYKNDMFSRAKEHSYSLPDSFLSGLEVMNNPVFHELFGNQVLSTDESLEIQSVTVLFTDIRGSTRMYSTLGDVRSYDIVREHFKLLFTSVKENNGYIVKTIGDAVMASFLKPSDAIRAAIKTYRSFKTISYEGAGHLEIKMGIHSGPVITVNMNDRLDYFGNTVNIAARVQSEAKDHSVCFTDRVLNSPAVRQTIIEHMGKKPMVKKREVQMRGLEHSMNIYTIYPDDPQ